MINTSSTQNKQNNTHTTQESNTHRAQTIINPKSNTTHTRQSAMLKHSNTQEQNIQQKNKPTHTTHNHKRQLNHA